MRSLTRGRIILIGPVTVNAKYNYPANNSYLFSNPCSLVLLGPWQAELSKVFTLVDALYPYP